MWGSNSLEFILTPEKLSLRHLVSDEGESEYFLPLGRAWGRLSGVDMHFYAQRLSDGALTQHKFCFGGGPAMMTSPTSTPQRSRPARPRNRRIRFKLDDQIIRPNDDVIIKPNDVIDGMEKLSVD